MFRYLSELFVASGALKLSLQEMSGLQTPRSRINAVSEIELATINLVSWATSATSCEHDVFIFRAGFERMGLYYCEDGWWFFKDN